MGNLCFIIQFNEKSTGKFNKMWYTGDESQEGSQEKKPELYRSRSFLKG